MRRHNIVSWILPILTVITFALAAPTLVQDKRRAYVDVVHVPKDVITVLEKRMDDDPEMWRDYAIRYYHNALAHWHVNQEGIHPEPAQPPNVPPPNPVDSNREAMELDDGAPAWSSESEDSHSEPPSPGSPTKSEDFHTTPPSPGSSTKSEDLQTAPPSPGSSTKSEDFHTAPSSPGPDSDSDPWSTVLNVPNTESLFENIKASDTEMGDKANVERRISGSVDSDAVKAAEMELRSTVDPGPFSQN